MLLPLVVIALLFLYYLFTRDPLTRFQKWSFGALVGGGLGNYVDRIFRPDGVVDFLDFKFYGIFGHGALADVQRRRHDGRDLGHPPVHLVPHPLAKPAGDAHELEREDGPLLPLRHGVQHPPDGRISSSLFIVVIGCALGPAPTPTSSRS